jgi:hypothetical protein
MRVVLLLAPLLLAGCGLLRDMPPAPEGIEHDGYILACESVAIDECTQEADHVADDLGPGRQLRWIIIRSDGHEACWQGWLQAGCEDEISGSGIDGSPEVSSAP